MKTREEITAIVQKIVGYRPGRSSTTDSTKKLNANFVAKFQIGFSAELLSDPVALLVVLESGMRDASERLIEITKKQFRDEGLI